MRSSPDEQIRSSDSKDTDITEPIAIVGVAAKFAKDATSVEDLWDVLREGRSTWSPIPKTRFNHEAFYHPDPEYGGTMHVQGGHFLREEPALFDSSFFNITKNEVLTLDPQQRLVMENVYHALENAGIPLARAIGSNTSVFVSGFNHDYLGMLNSDPETTVKYKPTGASNSIIANRVSWFFDFKGSSVTVDTACSSSLVALHLAVQSLRSRETTMAVVSGVSILENPLETTGYSHHGLLGAQGRCFSFDARAEGYARGEGVGTIVLKPLKQAVADGDVIRAVIRETGVNQDGRTPGITVPSGEAQEALIRQVYQRAGLNMQTTRFVEAHGTGTRVGDPIEAKALANAFDCGRDGPLHIGSLKSSCGHTEGASGVASLMKAILILESGIIPANYDLQDINPEILTREWNIKFPSTNTPWPTSGLRRVSINSFGIGGTNAHCVLDDAYNYLKENGISASHKTCAVIPPGKESKKLISFPPLAHRLFNLSAEDGNYDSDDTVSEVDFSETPITQSSVATPVMAPVDVPKVPKELPHLFILTAFDEDGIKRNSALYTRYVRQKNLQADGDVDLLQDLSFTMSARRSVFPWKSFVMASTAKELEWNLSEGNFTKPLRGEVPPDVSFVFTGQGAQYSAMGKALFAYPVFKSSMKEASKYLTGLGSSWSLLNEHAAIGSDSRVDIPEIAQPLCTALQIAMIELLASWGIYPTKVTGHSSGEIAAAYCAGKISREAAWKVAYFRGYLSSSQQSANGAMMAVGLSPAQLKPYISSVRAKLDGELKIACYNSPMNNTVSGDAALLDELKSMLDADSVFARKLKVRNAYHSSHMERIRDEYLRLMGCLDFGERLELPHQARMFSTLTGEEVPEDCLSSQYWVDNMISPVRFTVGLNKMMASVKENNDGSSNPSYLVEIGPHSTLHSAIRDTLPLDMSEGRIKYQALLNRSDPTLNPLLSTIGFLVTSGYNIDIHKVNLASRHEPSAHAKLLVDLPPYSFKHSEKILYESRLSKSLRYRKFPRHNLFGAPVPDWDANYPRWRHFVRLEENPWLRHHVASGNYVYPGVGYLVMAIEASRQLAGDKSITGFSLRQISIRRALIVPDSKHGIEVSVSMITESASELALWRRFQISSYNETSESWTEHCTGLISVEEQLQGDTIDNSYENEAEAQEWRRRFENLLEVCNHPIDFSRSYDLLLESGLNFGTLFRNLHDVRVTNSKLGKMTGVVTIPDTTAYMPKQFAHPHLIHPATMDSMIHMMIGAVLDFTGKPSLDKIRLPTFIRDMWVSADLNSSPGHSFEGHASVKASTSDKFEGQIRLFDATSRAHWISMNDIELTPLEMEIEVAPKRQVCTTIEWKPDVHFLDSETACALSKVDYIYGDDDLFWTKRLQLVTMIFVTEALNQLDPLDLQGLPPHFLRYYEWMKHVRQSLTDDKIIHLPLAEFEECFQNESMRNRIFKEVASHNAEGALTVRMGENIAAVMRQEVDPLHLMFGQGDLMEDLYRDTLRLYSLPLHLKSHLQLLRHQHSQLRILEVGGGTGSVTGEVLGILSPQCDTLNGSISEYLFTDISSGFFEKAQERFKTWKDVMKFQTFDLEKDPSTQGLEVGTYDLIFGGNVIHATSDLKATLQRLRSLLRPGGQIIMQEGVRQDFLWYPLSFGQLPGWWFGNEPIRKWCPYIPVSAWDSILLESGFSGVDIEYPSCEREDLSWQSIMISTALGPVNTTPQNVYIISSGEEDVADLIDCCVQLLGDNRRYHVAALTVAELHQTAFADSLCISLLDLDSPAFASLYEYRYNALKKMLLQCQQLLWVSPDTTEILDASMNMGLLRTIRSERGSDGSNIVTLTVSNCGNVATEDLAIWACAIVKHQFQSDAGKDRHAEYLLRDNIIHIARLRSFEEADRFLTLQSETPLTERLRIGDLQRDVRLENFESAGVDPRWVTDVQHNNPLPKTQIQVDVRAFSLTSYTNRLNMPIEAAGIVAQVGSAVRGLSSGDRVVYLASGSSEECFQTSTRIEEAVAIRLPDGISFDTAASLPAAFVTAIYGLRHIAKLSVGQTVLIHAGADIPGQAAIQYAQMVGAIIYATVSSREEKQFLIKAYNIPEGSIFSNKDLGFTKGVARCTNNVGVDVIFNTLSGAVQQESLSSLAVFGRFIDTAPKALRPSTTSAFSSGPQCISVCHIDLDLLIRHRPKIVREIVEDILCLYENGNLSQVQPCRVLLFSEVKTVIKSIQSPRASEKLVFTVDSEDYIPVVADPLPPLQFDEEASYVLAGGLGGLGRSIARWMAGRAAKHLIFLSRSGEVSDTASNLVADLWKMGCTTHIFACDVLDRHRLGDVLEVCHRKLPPIKGCIQCSMVLQDGSFEGMSLDSWEAATRPKVAGSWNLHELLPFNLDFFVMLSSVAGIFGNRGQANYAAGNSFQDALAAYRTSLGMKGSVIDLGSVANVGWVAENKERVAGHLDNLFQVLKEDEVHSAIEFMIDPRSNLKRNHAAQPVSQLVLGLPTAEICRLHRSPLPAYLRFSFFTHQRSTTILNKDEISQPKTISTAAQLALATTFSEVVSVVLNGIVEKLAALLAVPTSEIDAQRFSFDRIDSLVAMEFRSWIKKELNAEVSVLDIMGAMNIRSLGEKIAGCRNGATIE